MPNPDSWSAGSTVSIAEQKGRAYLRLRNFGDNTRHHCMSGEIVYQATTKWGVRLRSLPSGKHSLTCFDTMVNLSRSGQGEELNVMTYRLGPKHDVQDWELIYMNEGATCWIIQSRNKTNHEGAAHMSPVDTKDLGQAMSQCQLITSESTVKEDVPEACLDIYTTNCGPVTAGSYITGCGEYADDEQSCPYLAPQLPGC